MTGYTMAYSGKYGSGLITADTWEGLLHQRFPHVFGPAQVFKPAMPDPTRLLPAPAVRALLPARCSTQQCSSRTLGRRSERIAAMAKRAAAGRKSSGLVYITPPGNGDLLEAAAAAKAPVAASAIDSLMMALQQHIESGKQETVEIDGFLLVFKGEVAKLTHPELDRGIIVGAGFADDPLKFVARRAEVRDFLIKAQEAAKRPDGVYLIWRGDDRLRLDVVKQHGAALLVKPTADLSEMAAASSSMEHQGDHVAIQMKMVRYWIEHDLLRCKGQVPDWWQAEGEKVEVNKHLLSGQVDALLTAKQQWRAGEEIALLGGFSLKEVDHFIELRHSNRRLAKPNTVAVMTKTGWARMSNLSWVLEQAVAQVAV